MDCKRICERGKLKCSLSPETPKWRIFHQPLHRYLENKFSAKNLNSNEGKLFFSDFYVRYSHKPAYSNTTLTGCFSKLCSGAKGPSPITGILFQTNDVRLSGGRVEACSFGKKIGIFGLLRVVLHDFPVVSVTKKSIILQTSLTGRPSWPSLSLSTSSAELTRDLHDLAPSLALSVMCRTNGGRYAPNRSRSTKKPFCRARGHHRPSLKYF